MILPDSGGVLLHHRFLLFTGKGGVGKTTVVAALAVHAATLGMRPLVVELGHRASMRSVFGVADIDFEPRDVGHGVHAMSMDIERALLEYLVQHLPSRTIAKTIMRNKVLDRLFKAMPAVGEIATLNKLRALETQTESRKSGSPRWSPILVDLDATGHALMFLELRNVLQGLLGGGPMLRLIESTAEMFSDPHRTRLNLVTTPAELPVTETVELYTRLKAAGTVAFGRIFVNRVPSVELPGEDVGAMMGSLRTAAKAVGDAETLADLAFSHAAGRIARGAREQIERLVAAIDLPVVELPDLPATRMGTEELLHLGAVALVRPEAPGGYR